jgi:XTP/dITP diphosphohydrolase
VTSGLPQTKRPRINRILIATNNKGKVEEMRVLLQALDAELVTPEQIDLELHVAEDGKTYAENASKKATASERRSGLISLADDSGLEVDALDGAPGLYSARYVSKAGATDADRRVYLLKNLTTKPRPWLARFRAAIAVAIPGGSVQIFEGECPGEIIPEERGSGGFGYDPIFFIPQAGRTMAELAMEEKNRISHRARAVMRALPAIKTLLESQAQNISGS